MISKEQVDLAVAAAKDAIAPGADFAWVKQSAAVERAYHCGLFVGLRAIARGEDLDGLLRRTILGTLFMRSGDDPFRNTAVAKAYAGLKRHIVETKEQERHADPCEALEAELEKLDSFWNSSVTEARRILGEIKRIAPSSPLAADGVGTGTPQDREWLDQASGMLNHMERFVRIVSLVDAGRPK